METELTSIIKRATHTYKQKMGRLRTIRYADEVTTPTGIVDSIRFEDKDVGEITCKRADGCFYPDRKAKGCKGCVYRHHKVKTEMVITCFEVKITMSDFQSGHGKNFCGNENYYCVPKEMAPKVAAAIGDDSPMGILAWNGHNLRCYRPARRMNVSKEVACMVLYNALKKWCDGVQCLDR